MTWSRRWTLEAAGAVAGRIWFDAAAESLLIADGWGVAFASLSVRRVDASTGRVLATVRTRTSIRAFARAGRSDADALLLLGDKKIFAHDPATLERRGEYDKRVPRYSNAICDVGEAAVALAAPGALVEYDLTTSRSRRVAKVPAVALGVVDGRPFSVLADGGVLSRTAGWKAIGSFGESCYIAYIDAVSGAVAGLAGTRASAYDEDGNPQAVAWPRSRSLHHGCVRGDWEPHRRDLPFAAQTVGIVGGLLTAVDTDAGKTRVASVSLDALDSLMRVDTLPGAFAGFAGPSGLVVHSHPSRSDTSIQLSLFAPT